MPVKTKRSNGSENEEEISVAVGSYYVASNPGQLCCIGLGSCVAIALHDPRRHIGGLAHAMLPKYEEGRDKLNAGKYVDTAVYLMVDELIEMGAKKHALTAKIVGGSQMFQFSVSDTLDIGSRNIEAALATLEKEGITIIAEDVGGYVGRTIHFDLCTGKIRIQTSGKVTREI